MINSFVYNLNFFSVKKKSAKNDLRSTRSHLNLSKFEVTIFDEKNRIKWTSFDDNESINMNSSLSNA